MAEDKAAKLPLRELLLVEEFKMGLLIIIIGVSALLYGSSHSVALFYLLGFDNKILFIKNFLKNN